MTVRSIATVGFLAVLCASARADDNVIPALQVEAQAHPVGGTFFRLTPSIEVHDGIRIVSEPSGMVLGVIVTTDFEKTNAGRNWIATTTQPERDRAFVSTSPWDGVRSIGFFSPARPAGDDVVAFYLKGFSVPGRPSDEYVFRIGMRGAALTTRVSLSAMGPLGSYFLLCCYEEGNPCRNCKWCKEGQPADCCPSPNGDQTCSPVGNFGCRYSEATCGFCMVCGG